MNQDQKAPIPQVATNTTPASEPKHAENEQSTLPEETLGVQPLEERIAPKVYY